MGETECAELLIEANANSGGLFFLSRHHHCKATAEPKAVAVLAAPTACRPHSLALSFPESAPTLYRFSLAARPLPQSALIC